MLFQDTRFVRGLKGGEDGRFGCGSFFLLALQDAFEELGYGAFAGCDCGDFGAWG
jgi:hypothetical protein